MLIVFHENYDSGVLLIIAGYRRSRVMYSMASEKAWCELRKAKIPRPSFRMPNVSKRISCDQDWQMYEPKQRKTANLSLPQIVNNSTTEKLTVGARLQNVPATMEQWDLHSRIQGAPSQLLVCLQRWTAWRSCWKAKYRPHQYGWTKGTC